MPKVESLRTYPVAGLSGYEVPEMIITPEAIVGDRTYAVVLESELKKLIQDPSYTPLRMTQTSHPELTLFGTSEEDGKLVLLHGNERFEVGKSVIVEEPTRHFHTESDTYTSLAEALPTKALPFRVSRRSQSQRWAEDCGDGVAAWLSEKLGENVRLVKAVKHPEAKKHHFTWYTDIHAVTRASLEQLAEDTEAEVDDLTFRWNMMLTGTDAYEEEQWNEAVIDGAKAVVSLCQRCKYIGIERATAVVGHYVAVLKEVAQNHGMNFGVYFKVTGEETITIRVGDTISVIQNLDQD